MINIGNPIDSLVKKATNLFKDETVLIEPKIAQLCL